MRIAWAVAAAVLLAPWSATSAEGAPGVSAFATGRVAVLEFQNRVPGASADQIDAGYFTDRVRTAVLKASPGLTVITKENVVELLKAQGRSLEECESKAGCEVETGRLLGADLVITGAIYRVGMFKLNMKMHSTREGRLLSGSTAAGRSAESLDEALDGAVKELLAPLRPQDATVTFGLSESLPAVPQAPSAPQAAPMVDANGVDPDVMVAHDAALAADDRGKEDPQAAAKAWQAVAESRSKNPFRDEAIARQKQWQEFADKKKAFEDQLAKDTEQLRKLLPLSQRSVSDQTKVDLLVRHARLYGNDKAGALVALIPQPEARQAAARALACEAHDADACVQLARLHVAAKDMGRAALDFGRACDSGSAEACEELGGIYLGGAGGQKDVTRGLATLGKACDAGRAGACRRAALVWDEGAGVKPDKAKALPLYEKACDGGDGESCRRLALGYEAGVGMAHDPVRAETFFRRACHFNDDPGCARVRQYDAQAAAAQRAREEREAAARAEQDRREAAARARQEEWEAKRDSAHTGRVTGGVLAGVGIALAAGSGFFALQGSQQNDKVRQGNFQTAKDIQAALDAGHTDNTLALGLALGAAASVGVGVVLWVFNPAPKDQREVSGERARVQVAVTPSGIVLAGALP